jgi:hypothetical protein
MKITHKNIIVVLLFFTTLSFASGPCICGLLENWSFEKWSGPMEPEYWNNEGGGLLVYRKSNAKCGRFSAMMVNDYCPGSCLSQTIDIIGGHKYILLFWGYVPSPSKGGDVAIYWYDANGYELHKDAWPVIGIDVFTRQIRCPEHAPANAVTAKIAFEPDWDYGTLIIDGVCLFDLPVNPSIYTGAACTGSVSVVHTGTSSTGVWSCIIDSSKSASLSCNHISSTNTLSENVKNHGCSNLTFSLSQNTPNPLIKNKGTTISYSIPYKSDVDLSIYNNIGQRVRTLVNEVQERGIYTVLWDGKNDKNEDLASGVYFCQMHAGNYSETRNVLLLK